jgi:hypothetical protein
MISPHQALQQLLQPTGLAMTLFPPTSRYYGIETAMLENSEGKTVIYIKQRIVPSSDRFALLQEHPVVQGERLDNITARYLGDPEQFWKICDANNAMHPDELTETIGRRLRITLPEGIPGVSNA